MISTTVPTAYRHWQKLARSLIDPLVPLMEEGRSEIPLIGNVSDHDANADRLEAYARPCLLISLWLRSHPDPEDPEDLALRERLAQWLRQALLIGSNPASDSYWGPNTNYHQNGVEIGLLAIALHLSQEQLWDPLTEAEKQQVARWMATNRCVGHHWNNHFYFSVFTLEFLQHMGYGRPSDRASIDYWMNEMEAMYRGDGWFMDGVNQTYDHYNAYAFHYYGLIWSHLYGHNNPERARRWESWTGEFLQSYQHMFAASGEHPAFGRSIAYRFNATGPFSLAAFLGVNPLSPGKTRRLCTRNLEFFLNRPIQQSQGALSIGWHDEFPGIAEPYTCAGSVYWCAKAFSTFLMPPEHPFWSAEEEPLESEKGDFVHIIPTSGMVLRSISGEVEILNAGTEITPMNRDKFGPYKWGKIAYRTGVGFQVGVDTQHYTPDLGVTCQYEGDDRVFGRHYTTPLAVQADHYAAAYALGDKINQAVTLAEGYIWWKNGWILQIHWLDAYSKAQFKLGGYSLSSRDPSTFREQRTKETHSVWSEGRGSVIQRLLSDSTLGDERRLDDSKPRTHVQAPYHITPVLETGTQKGEFYLGALAWAGTDPEEAQPWKVIEVTGESLHLEHPKLGGWTIHHPILSHIKL